MATELLPSRFDNCQKWLVSQLNRGPIVPLAKRNGVGKDYVEKRRKVRAHEAMHTSRRPPKWTPRAKTTHANSARGCVRAGVPLIPPKVARPYAGHKSPSSSVTQPINMPPQGFLHTSPFPELIPTQPDFASARAPARPAYCHTVVPVRLLLRKTCHIRNIYTVCWTGTHAARHVEDRTDVLCASGKYQWIVRESLK